MQQALIIIDVQNDYFSQGKMPLDHPEQALTNILVLQTVFRQQNKPIFYIQHINTRTDATFFIANSNGVAIHPHLLPIAGENEKIIIKHLPNSFKATSLQADLVEQGVKQLVICGMMTHMCVDSTTRQAAELGYQPILIADACTTRDLVFQLSIVPAKQVQTAFMSALSSFSTIYDHQQFISILTNKLA